MFAFLLMASMVTGPAAKPCGYDREKMLALDERTFDQDGKTGWRILEENPRCYVAAADIIRDYRKAHHSSASILFWHEGQMRASAGQTKAAIPLFEKSRKQPDPAGWNLYVDGTIAFLRHDRHALQAARDRLAALPTPADWHAVGPDGKPFPIKWPPNLNVLDGLLKCFDRSYDEAYSSAACTKPIG